MSATLLALQEAMRQEDAEAAYVNIALDFDAQGYGVGIAVDWRRGNLTDRLDWRPGRIIRCEGTPHEVIFPFKLSAGRPAVDGDI